MGILTEHENAPLLARKHFSAVWVCCQEMSRMKSYVVNTCKAKQADRMSGVINRYCANHPVFAWLLVLIGMPVLVLMSVALCACIVAIPFLWIP